MFLVNNEALSRLRRLLRDMTESSTPPYKHAAMLANMRNHAPHTIQPLDTSQDVLSFTCGMHAFGFQESGEYAAIARYGDGEVFSGPDFFRWLMESERLVEISGSATPSGSIVMYFANGHPVHIGRLRTATRVVSKWGTGLLYDHEITEVPDQYGSEVRFFASIDHDAALDHFVSFAEERGIPFED